MIVVSGSLLGRVDLGEERNVPGPAIRGVVADLDIRLNESEHQRRREAEVGAEARRDVLDRLAHLSTEWVPAREVDRAELQYLADHARDTIEIRHTVRDTQVRRRLVPPLVIERVTVHARTWERGFATLNALAGLAQRCLVLTAEPADLELAGLESSLYGIGLAVDRAGDLLTLVVPAPFSTEVFTSLAWQVAEEAYDSALGSGLL